MENVQFETKSSFNLTIAEKRTMYVRMALCRFSYLRSPEYNENLLLAKLTEDFKQLSSALNEMAAQNSNSYTIHKLVTFFDIHYKNLLELKSSTN